MGNTNRRSMIKGLFGVPIIGAAAEWFVTSEAGAHGPSRKETPEYRRRFRAVQILRSINTMQRRYHAESGGYATLEALVSSELVAAWLDSKTAEKSGIGRSLIQTLSLGSDEISPGWRCRFNANQDRSRYTVTLVDTTPDNLPAFSTDERAVIYQGKFVAQVGSPGEWRTAATSLVGDPIGKHLKKPRRSRVASFFHWFAAGIVTPVYASHCYYPEDCCCSGCCCHEYLCCNGFWCSCQPSCGCPSGYSCQNCGCQCCVWQCCWEVP